MTQQDPAPTKRAQDTELGQTPLDASQLPAKPSEVSSEQARKQELEPTPPDTADETEIEAAQQEADQMAASVTEQVHDLSMRRKLSTFGSNVEREASQQISLLEERLDRVMEDLEGGNAEIPNNLMKLRQTMDELNPEVQLEEAQSGLGGLVAKLLGKTPGIGDALQRIAYKYQTVQTQIDQILGGLRAGRDKLLQDNIELEQLHEQVRQKDKQVRLTAYKGELLWQRLEEAIEQTEDEARKRELEALLGKVASRVQDLRMMEQVFQQFYASIRLTHDNNQELVESAKRTETVTSNTLTIGLAIQVALKRQKDVAEAVQQTQEATSELLAQNARAVREQGAEIRELNNNPVLAMEKIQSAYDDLMAAMDETEQVRMEGVRVARQNVAELKAMSEKMGERTQALKTGEGADELIEGTELPQEEDEQKS